MSNKKNDLREVLKDAHAHFYMLKGHEAERLRMWDIQEDCVVIDIPKNAPLRKTILGFVPSLSGNAIFEVEGTVSDEGLPDQMDNTICLLVSPENVKRINRRLFPRYSFTPPLGVKIGKMRDEDAIDGKIINVSAGGLRIETPSPLEADVDYLFEFDIEVDGEVHSLFLTGNILYEIPLEKAYSYGVRFIDMDENDMECGEAPVQSLDRTVDLLGLVNKLIVLGETENA